VASAAARTESSGASVWHWLSRPLLLEGRAGVERLALIGDPLFRGQGVPRGKGAPVLLIPGLMAGDWSLTMLSGWLRRIGYAPFESGLRVNGHESEATVGMLGRKLHQAFAETSQPVTLVGHSRGGMLAAVLAQRQPEIVRQVITLGSPLNDPFAVSPLTRMAIRSLWLRGGVTGPLTEHPRFQRDLAARPRVPTTSMYSRSDAIVDWRACMRDDVRCIEVRGSHIGLAANREVYREIAGLLRIST